MSVASLSNGVYFFSEFLPKAAAGFSGREYDAAHDLASFLKAFGAEKDRFCTVEQVHGDKVILVAQPLSSRIETADGLVTREKGLALVIRTADCVPVFFWNHETPAVGICHGGWRGVKGGIIFRTLDLFQSHFSIQTKSLKVAMGPSIGECCYEVGAEFQGYFPGRVKEKEGRYFFDLKGMIKQQLLERGVLQDSISVSDFCTSCSVDRFFSARREGVETGRFLSAIMLK